MMKSRLLLFLVVLWTGMAQAQEKYERAYRIKKSQFPQNAQQLMEESMTDIRRVKFYKQTDSLGVGYIAKFKKDRLWYSTGFDEMGHLEDISIIIQEMDIPSETFDSMVKYIQEAFYKHRIIELQQRYPIVEGKRINEILDNAFQNLLLPGIQYKVLVTGSTKKEKQDYELLFSSLGALLKTKKSLPKNHARILY